LQQGVPCHFLLLTDGPHNFFIKSLHNLPAMFLPYTMCKEVDAHPFRQVEKMMRSIWGWGLPVLIAGVCLGCGDGASPSRVARIQGGGATFIQPIMEEWAYAYQQARGVEIDYQAKGSGNGIQQMTARTLDFGCSDAPMKRSQREEALTKGGEVIHIPLVLGAVVPVYNLPGIEKPLIFDGPTLADIYLGKVTRWNDPALQSLNPGVTLPDLPISPVYRAEASGTTNIFTEFLAKASPEFKAQIGASTQPTWPKGIGTGERENAGVVGRIKNSSGTIGYAEIRFAKVNQVAYGAVKNRAGKVVQANPEAITAAALHAMNTRQTEEPYSLHDLTFSLTDAAGEDAYPISGVTYALIYKKQKAAMGRALRDFFLWCVHEGQEFAIRLDYAPLPEALVKKIEARLEQIELEP
jgi:phosphate transport system substrate-binding protein